jgi:tetratricopeptide (TPR) repeat protein
MTRRGVIAHAQVLSQLERAPDALALIDGAFGQDPDPAIVALRADLAAGKPLPFDVVATASDGVAEVLYTVAAALVQDNQDVYTLAYARLAYHVRPAHLDAILLSAEILEAQDQFDLASEAYNLIPQESPAFHVAEMGRADALVQAGRTDAAIEALQQLAKAQPDLASVWSKLGDVLRQQERFVEAEAAYDKAIGTFETPQAGQWVVYYARGIAKERQKLWDPAVADFRKALELSPDQPHVLNYLGYGFLEQKTNYDEALSMIEKAVAARPQDGYIVDSLGWALYRLGRYPEAVGPMEQAVELMPVDPIVNDHLGDVYWAVGRVLEAEFQWKRALSFEPETEAEATRIRRKLEVGLDAVLAEEGAAPLSVSENGD